MIKQFFPDIKWGNNISSYKGYAFCPAPWNAGSKSLIETDMLLVTFLTGDQKFSLKLKNAESRIQKQISEETRECNEMRS